MSNNHEFLSELHLSKLLLENASEGFTACDNSFKILYGNKRAYEFHGVPENYDPDRWSEFCQLMELDGETPTLMEDYPLIRALKGEIVTDNFKVLKRKNLPSILVKYSARPLYDADGKQIGAMLTTEDRQDMMASEARFKAIFDQSPLSIQILSKTGKVLFANKAFKELWNITEEFFQNYFLKEYNMYQDELLIKSGRLEPFLRAFAGELAYIEPFYYDPTTLGLDARARWAKAVLYPLKNPAGEVSELVIIHQDVTDEYEASADKEKLLSQLTAIVSQMPAGIVVEDNKGEVLIYNQKIKDMIGGPEVAKEVFAEPLRRAAYGEILSSQEIETGDGADKRIYSASSGPVKDPLGNTSSSVLMVRDVTSEKRSESNEAFLMNVQSLLISSIEYDQVIDKIASAAIPYLCDGCVIDTKEDGNIKRIVTKHKDPITQLHMNELEDKYPAKEGSPEPCVKVIETGTPLLIKNITPEILKASSYNEDHLSIITKVGIRSTMVVPLRVRGKVIGSVSFIITTGRGHFDDVDFILAQRLGKLASLAIDNAKLYTDAMSGIQLREEFISIASHELRTPITSINLQLEVINDLLSSLDVSSESGMLMKKFLSGTNKQLERLTRLVDDMLDISRINTGKLFINRRKIEFISYLKEVLSRFSDQLTIDLQCPQQLSIICDPERMDQVITNFMTNAIRYGGKKPIHVIVEEKNSSFVLIFRDEGQGIKKEDQQRIFKRFERVKSDDNVNGLGLGLYINKQIVEEHGGTISVESELGKGSTFIVNLPK